MYLRKFLTFSAIYLAVFLLIHIGVFFLIKHQQKNFSISALNQLIYTVSPLRSSTNDPCSRTFAQEPYTKNYYKIYLTCSNGTKATNTIDLDAVTDKTTKGVITEFARIMNFDPNLILDSTHSYCTSTQTGKSVDFNSQAINLDTLKCSVNLN